MLPAPAVSRINAKILRRTCVDLRGWRRPLVATGNQVMVGIATN
jgi:hypothetical protein